MADELCPTCHSKIRLDGEEDLSRVRGSQSPGEGQSLPDTILSSDTEIVPFWSRDPALTIGGFNGPDFKGLQRTFASILKEIQEVRTNEEIEIGISEEDRTDFSELSSQHVRNGQINELRESVEKILNISGSNLAEYFSLDAEGNTVAAGPNDTPNKEEWTDTERGKTYIHKDGSESGEFELPDGTIQQSPSLSANIKVRAAHLEDLRHPMQLSWREFWSVTTAPTIFDDSSNFEEQITVSQGALRPPPPFPDLGSIGPRIPGRRGGTITIINNLNDILPFPTDEKEAFNIAPTDVGNRYLSLDDDRTWLIRARQSAVTISTNNRELFWDRESAASFGCGERFPSAGFESGLKTEPIASSSLTTSPSTDADVLALKPESRELKFTYSRSGFHPKAFIAEDTIGSPTHIFTMSHFFQTGEGTGGGISQAFSDRRIRINADTSFKYLIKHGASGSIDAKTIDQSAGALIPLRSGIFADLQGSEIRYAPVIPLSQSASDFFGIPISEPITSLFRSSQLSWIIRFSFPKEPSKNNQVRIRLADNTALSEPPFTTIEQAPFGGQSFKVGGNALIVFIDEKTEFDEVFNFNDYLAVKEIKSAGFFEYNNQKIEDPEDPSKTIKNPDAEEVIIDSVVLDYRGGAGEAGSGTELARFFGTTPKFLDIVPTSFISTPNPPFEPIISPDPCTTKAVTVQGNTSWTDFTESGFFSVEAIRIENSLTPVRPVTEEEESP